MTIVRFVNRKFAWEGLTKGKNLKGTNLYCDGNAIYINNSFCREFKYYGFLIRCLKRDKRNEGYEVVSGVFHIKKLGGNKYEEMSHVSDFEDHNLDISVYDKDKCVFIYLFHNNGLKLIFLLELLSYSKTCLTRTLTGPDQSVRFNQVSAL